jgi:cation transport regulator ChaC
MYLFGYGSLINLISAQKSFKRELKQSDLIAVNIKGYDKVWNAMEFIEFEENKTVNGIFLNLKKDENKSTNGVVVKITDEELELLKLREKNYSCITIKASDVKNVELPEDVIAFMTTREDKIANTETQNCFIAAKYIDILTDAFGAYDDEFVNEYKKSLINFPFEVKEGIYRFCDPVQHKFAREGVRK